MTLSATFAIALYASLALNPLLTAAAERLGAGMPVAVRADWPSDQELQPPPDLRP